MATQGHDGKVLAALLDRKPIAEKLVKDGSPQAIANIIWAMATLGYKSNELAGIINRQNVAETLVKYGTPQTISNTIWALATLGHDAKFWLESLIMRTLRGC
mmetsp:Transcript_4330/g.11203  ORF Transcript_4330/g.11203 Transcript_4330/m.11203 type:complete len:102 (+) Transcript_4330:1105-1410(+)